MFEIKCLIPLEKDLVIKVMDYDFLTGDDGMSCTDMHFIASLMPLNLAVKMEEKSIREFSAKRLTLTQIPPKKGIDNNDTIRISKSVSKNHIILIYVLILSLQFILALKILKI